MQLLKIEKIALQLLISFFIILKCSYGFKLDSEERCETFSEENFQGKVLTSLKASDIIFDTDLILKDSKDSEEHQLVNSLRLNDNCGLLLCDLPKLKGNCVEYFLTETNLSKPFNFKSAVCKCLTTPEETNKKITECAILYKDWYFNGLKQNIEFASAGRINLGYSSRQSVLLKSGCELTLWKSLEDNKVASLHLENSTTLINMLNKDSYDWYCCQCDLASRDTCKTAMDSSLDYKIVPELEDEINKATSGDIPDFVRYGKKVIGIGRNYRWKKSELTKVLKEPDEPIVFMKPTTSYIVEGQQIELPESLGTIFYEIELGVVIGKRGKSISKSKALDHVSGYFLVLDMTAKEFLKKSVNQSKPWEIGKGFDTACPVSHFIPKHLIPNPNDIHLLCKVNGNVTQSANTNEMIFDVPTLISYISRYMTLEPNDVILTGTPDGLGPIYDGDIIEGQLGNITTIRFPVFDAVTFKDV